MNIFVGNIPDGTTEGDLERAFEKFGEVLSVSVIKERTTGTPKGYAFVEMFNKAEAEKAIAGLNGTQFQGQTISVNEARPKGEAGARGKAPGRKW